MKLCSYATGSGCIAFTWRDENGNSIKSATLEEIKPYVQKHRDGYIVVKSRHYADPVAVRPVKRINDTMVEIGETQYEVVLEEYEHGEIRDHHMFITGAKDGVGYVLRHSSTRDSIRFFLNNEYAYKNPL